MEEQKSKSSKILEIIIVIVIIGILGFICYDKVLNKSNNTNNTNTNAENKEEKNVKEVAIESDTVKTVMESFDKIRIDSDSLYKDGGFNIENVSKLDVLLTATDNLDSKYIDPCNKSYKAEIASVDVLNITIEKYILNQRITLDDVKTLKNSNEGIDFIKLKENGIILEGVCGGEFTPSDYVERKVVKAETEGDYLYIYEKNAFARYNEQKDLADIPTINYFKDYKRTEVLEKDKKSLNVIGPDVTIPEADYPKWNLYDTYKYTFKKVNNIYYFQSFNLSK